MISTGHIAGEEDYFEEWRGFWIRGRYGWTRPGEQYYWIQGMLPGRWIPHPDAGMAGAENGLLLHRVARLPGELAATPVF